MPGHVKLAALSKNMDAHVGAHQHPKRCAKVLLSQNKQTMVMIQIMIHIMMIQILILLMYGMNAIPKSKTQKHTAKKHI